MADVGAAEPWNSRSLAPIARDLFFVHPEFGFVRSDGAAAPEHDAGHAPHRGIAGDVKHQPIDPVQGFADFFQHEHVAVEIGLQRFYARAASTFADVRVGDVVLYEDAYGNVALAINAGSAAGMLAAKSGDAVAITVRSGS